MIIGLTGGIASGKSTAAKFLASEGAQVMDGDFLGHRAYEPNTAAFSKIIETFGIDRNAGEWIQEMHRYPRTILNGFRQLWHQ